MRFLRFLFPVVFATAAGSFAASPEVWSLPGRKVVFVQKNGATVDAECAERAAKCEALQRFPESDIRKLKPEDLANGANPGGAICEKVLGGTNIIGFDTDKNRSSFCLFKDGSYLDGGSIFSEGAKKFGK